MSITTDWNDVVRLGRRMLVLLFLSTASAVASTAPPSEISGCSMLLMDFECEQYRQRLAHAGNEVERGSIEHEYRQLHRERQKYCPCKGIQDRRLRQELRRQAGLSCT